MIQTSLIQGTHFIPGAKKFAHSIQHRFSDSVYKLHYLSAVIVDQLVIKGGSLDGSESGGDNDSVRSDKSYHTKGATTIRR